MKRNWSVGFFSCTPKMGRKKVYIIEVCEKKDISIQDATPFVYEKNILSHIFGITLCHLN